MTQHPPVSSREQRFAEGTTLVPMLVWGLLLGIVGMLAVVIFV